MHVWIDLSRGWGIWGLQTELFLERILMEHQWPVSWPSLGCLRLRDTKALVVLTSIWGFIVLLWGLMDWMRPKWLCFSLCPWVVWHSVGLLHWMYHTTRLRMIWPKSFWDSLHLTLSLMFRGEGWMLWGRGQRPEESITSFISRWREKISQVIDRSSEMDQISMIMKKSLQPRFSSHLMGFPHMDFGSLV